ncbi:MAG: putative toxin-antitoxin system toxin component, PIN family [Candidatus Thiosymbion ectosymbiont of Robbea hypermnestra]|nr:putative toxin-antitoxin system toxin component, PIN family [Candidatus Thiosymbion ectosymbiont of Robbea hypermnestra]
MRLVLDTNVLVSGLIWGGVPRRLLELGRDGQAMLFTSQPLLDELSGVLERDKFAAPLASQRITPAFLVQRYGILAELVEPEPIARTVPHDADDDVVIATALAAQADIIATGDKELLGLHPWRGIRILDAAATLGSVLN